MVIFLFLGVLILLDLVTVLSHENGNGFLCLNRFLYVIYVKKERKKEKNVDFTVSF